MIQPFIDRFIAQEHAMKERLASLEHPDYADLFKLTIEAIAWDDDYDDHDSPDPTRIHEIDDGDCQGTLLFVVAARDYQPCNYWYTFISYGSCSGCDVLQDVLEENEQGSPERAAQLWTLCLHMVQGMRYMKK